QRNTPISLRPCSCPSPLSLLSRLILPVPMGNMQSCLNVFLTTILFGNLDNMILSPLGIIREVRIGVSQINPSTVCFLVSRFPINLYINQSLFLQSSIQHHNDFLIRSFLWDLKPVLNNQSRSSRNSL